MKKEDIAKIIRNRPFTEEMICSDRKILPVVCYNILSKVRDQFLLIAPDVATAEELYGGISELKELFGFDGVFFLFDELQKKDRIVAENEIEKSRILFEILNNGKGVITSAEVCFSILDSPQVFSKNCFTLRTGDSFSLKLLAEKLSLMDYDDEYQVNTVCEFALRGGIIDLYSPLEPYPARIEFFGDEIESIRYFSPDTQKTISKIDSYTIIQRSAVGSERANYNLTDYFQKDLFVVVIFPLECKEKLSNKSLKAFEKFIETQRKKKNLVSVLREIELDISGDLNLHENFQTIPSTAEEFLDEDIELLGKDLYSQMRRDQIKYWLDNQYRVALFTGTKLGKKHVSNYLKANKIDAKLISFCEGFLSRGFLLLEEKIAVLSEKEIYYNPHSHTLYQKNLFKRTTRETQEANIAELDVGDYVVHLLHGIGIYHGITEIEMSGATREVIELEYEDEVKVYVPVWQANMVTRYVGTLKNVPTLSKLGSSRWNIVKAAAAASVKQFAVELIQIQAVRLTSKGFSFPIDDEEQINFEMSFPFEETLDQLRATKEIKEDLSCHKPMDRLLCGDVGFGKTEVAMRAAFKAVMAGKQVAILSPTTILAQQHFYTFSERFSEYPILIEVLSRFKSKSEQKKIIEDLSQGKIDIVIGTHRLLNNDVVFENLGLLIIDEEQKFGVLHKERFKRMRFMVDILTMTATPIPRTLYFALSGIRDLSTITTAPSNRLPVQTILCKYDNAIITEAIYREVRRGGQVFFVHNRVKTIEQRCSQLRELMADISIEIAHGQMEDDELEYVMTKFIDGKIDVLVSTTIIESGVDIPNANTIIIERADRFGLAELYQLRGRVGRWSRQAYAYILIPDSTIISTTARERLSAIRKYTQLGAGFKLALKDLEIRGSGNLLGSQQSGHINAIGFNLYCQLLKSTVASLKDSRNPRIFYVDLFFDFIDFALEAPKNKINACIPKEYVPSERLRLEFYRRFSEIWDIQTLEDIRNEMIDRFGKIPVEIDRFITIMTIRIKLAISNYSAISVRNNYIYIEGDKNRQFLVNGKIPKLKNSDPDLKLNEILQLVGGS